MTSYESLGLAGDNSSLCLLTKIARAKFGRYFLAEILLIFFFFFLICSAAPVIYLKIFIQERQSLWGFFLTKVSNYPTKEHDKC